MFLYTVQARASGAFACAPDATSINMLLELRGGASCL
jgi:hypothetical protein